MWHPPRPREKNDVRVRRSPAWRSRDGPGNLRVSGRQNPPSSVAVLEGWYPSRRHRRAHAYTELVQISATTVVLIGPLTLLSSLVLPSSHSVCPITHNGLFGKKRPHADSVCHPSSSRRHAALLHLLPELAPSAGGPHRQQRLPRLRRAGPSASLDERPGEVDARAG